MSWVRRIRHPSGQPLQQVQSAARDLAEHVAPGKGRIVFETVADVAIISSVVIGGALGLVHLYRSLFPRHKDEQTPKPANADGSPPRRPDLYTTMAFADGQDGHEERGHRSR